MAFWDSIASGTVKGLAEGAGQLAIDLRTAITGEAPIDPNKRAEILAQAAALEAAAIARADEFDKAQMSGQIGLLTSDSASPSLFKSGWRPAAGWICVAGLAYTFLARPLLPWLITVGGLIVGRDALVPALPPLDMTELYGLLVGMLGLGGLRSWERGKGVLK